VALACHVSPTEGSRRLGVARTRDQIMADTLVERLTGQARAVDVAAEVAITIPVTALTGEAGGATAEVVGHGPIPAELAKEILAESAGRRWWRRLFTAPHGGIAGGDPRRRCFDGVLAASTACWPR
jgi:hypothetical protein